MSKKQISEEILQVCQWLHAKNFLAAADGNVSYRISDDEILITPRGKLKSKIQTDEIAVINLKGEVLSGEPSSERLMHLEVFRRCPQARAVVHAHPPCSIAWSVARPELNELPAQNLSELILAVGSVPIVPYAQPSTKEMGTNLHPFLPDSRAMILARHGVLCWGEDLLEAYAGVERLEHAAQVLLYAEQLGGASEMPQDEVEKLRAQRKEIGSKTL